MTPLFRASSRPGRYRRSEASRPGGALGYGTKTPCVWNSELPAVATRPSEPPSNTCTLPSSQIARSPVLTDPGTTALALVAIAQVAPAVRLVVVEGGTVTGKEVSVTVAGVVEATSL